MPALTIWARLSSRQWEKTAKELGIKTFPETIEPIKVKPEKIEFIDMSLKKTANTQRELISLNILVGV
jgi:hypothetical protein